MSEYVRDLRRRDRLGSRLMATTLLLACTIGVVLNIGQIFADSRSQSAELDRVVDRLMFPEARMSAAGSARITKCSTASRHRRRPSRAGSIIGNQ